MKEQLIKLANRIEQVRKNSRLPTYQQTELTEIKYALLKLTNDVPKLIILTKNREIKFVIKSKDPERELSLRGFKKSQVNPEKWFNINEGWMMDAIIMDSNEEWPQI